MGIESIGEIGGKHADYRLDMAFRSAESGCLKPSAIRREASTWR